MVAKKRLGVGAAPSSAAAAVENVSEGWTKSIKKQILSVGLLKLDYLKNVLYSLNSKFWELLQIKVNF